MAISKPRNRVVLFRLTQEEYNQVQQACADGEARSVSDFARARILGAGAAEPAALSQLEAKVSELAQQVERLAAAIESRMAPRTEVAAAGFAGAAFQAKQGS